jgi:hypothetical protein
MATHRERRKERLRKAMRLENTQGLDLRTGCQVTLAAHEELNGKKRYQMAPTVCPGNADPFDGIKKLYRRLSAIISDEKRRIAQLTTAQRQLEIREIESRLRKELSKPPKKIQ